MIPLRLLAVAAALFAAAPAGAEPTQVAVGVHVVELRAVDARAESFYADLYIWLRYRKVDDEKLQAVIEKIEPVNGKFDSLDVIDEKTVGEERYICYRATGTFFFVPDLRLYPFDTQALPITIESSSMEMEELLFVDDRVSYERAGSAPERWGVAPSLLVPDYHLSRVERLVVESKYPTNFGDPSKTRPYTHYSRFSVKVSLVREYWSYAFKILVPLLIILAMAYLVFFLPAAQLDTSASVAMTALLSCMAYNVAVTQNMPEIGYLVLSDKFFIATYVLLLVTLGQTFVTFVVDADGRGELARRIDLVSRWTFPLLVGGIFALFMAGV